jgi:NAD(P)-dependent dehydrogenase (short-subunit alcohol dehydrogenase family)
VLATDLRPAGGIDLVHDVTSEAAWARYGRLARPEQVAAGVVHLLSPASAFTTGAEVVIDGGLTAA